MRYIAELEQEKKLLQQQNEAMAAQLRSLQEPLLLGARCSWNRTAR